MKNKKNVAVLGLLLIAVLLIIFSYQKRQQSEPTIIPIFSDDGSVELQVPEGALPEGVSPEDISIVQDSDLQLPLRIEGVDLIAYDLQPDGLEFSETAHIRVPFDEDPQLYFHGTEEEIQLIDEVTYVIDDGGNYAMVPLNHFSVFVRSSNAKPIFKVSGSGSDIEVGQSLNARAKVERTGTTYTVYYKSGRSSEFRLVEGTQRIKGAVLNSTNIAPLGNKNKPPKSIFTDSYTITTDEFVCRRSGPSETEFSLTLTWDKELTGVDGALTNWIGKQGGIMFANVHVKFECKPKPPECGDGIAQGAEECDGRDFRRKTCKDFGFNAGYLNCTSECTIDKSMCENQVEISCNENAWSDESDAYEKYVCISDCPEGLVCGNNCKCYNPTDEIQPESLDLSQPGEDDLPGLDDPEKEKLEVIRYGDDFIPVSEIHSFTGPECDKEAHWHPNTSTVLTVKGERLSDPNPSSCGFGKVYDHPVIEIEVLR